MGSIGIHRVLCTPWSTSSFSSHWCPRHYHRFCTRAGHCHRRYGLYSDSCTGAIYCTIGLEGKNLTVQVMDCKPTIQDPSVHSQYSWHTVVQNKIGFGVMISATPRNGKPRPLSIRHDHNINTLSALIVFFLVLLCARTGGTACPNHSFCVNCPFLYLHLALCTKGHPAQ